MNNILNIKRFGLVLRKDIMEGWKRYTLMFLTMLGILTVGLIWTYYDFSIVNGETILHKQNRLNIEALGYLSFLFCIFGLIFSSTFMNPMNSKTKKISYLINPSSSFEKYFSRWIIITVVYIILFFVAMWIADTIRITFYSTFFSFYLYKVTAFVDLTQLIYMGDDLNSSGYLLPKSVFLSFLSIYFFFQSLLILGSTFWEKSTFIKTFTAIAVIVIVFVLVCRWTILLFYGEFDGFAKAINILQPVKNIDLNETAAAYKLSAAIFVFALINWILAFFRFRESEIIKRL